MVMDNVIVGAGFAGSVLARRIAEELNQKVLLIERRNHIGGNAHDYFNENGILIHKYGPHIFHTTNQTVYKWLSRFTEWYHYQHKVLAYVDGQYIPMPISVETVNALFGLDLSTDDFAAWLETKKQKRDQILTSEDVILANAGKDIYEKIFKNYTFKQWGKYPSELDASITRRIPIRNSRDGRYFSDQYQGLPLHGYTKLFERMLDHPNVHIMLNTDWKVFKDSIKYKSLYYTGAIDEFYDYKYGKLEYRSVRFEYETYFDREYYQSVGTVNYPNDYDFTRITEYKHLTGQKHPYTTIAREYSSETGDPYYIVPNTGKEKLEAYRALLDGKVVFIGRLAEYAYYNMDQIVQRALDLPLK